MRYRGSAFEDEVAEGEVCRHEGCERIEPWHACGKVARRSCSCLARALKEFIAPDSVAAEFVQE